MIELIEPATSILDSRFNSAEGSRDELGTFLGATQRSNKDSESSNHPRSV